MKANQARLAAVLAASAIAIALTACGGGTVPPDSIEETLIGQAPPALGVESASCPDDVSDADGTEFECTATTTDGEEYEVPGTVIGAEEGSDTVGGEFDFSGISGASTGTTGA